MSGGFESCLRSYLEALKVRGCAASTIGGRAKSLRLFFRHLERLGVGDIREVTPAHVEAYQAWLMEPRRYAAGTVAVYLSAVCLFFRHLQDADAILLDPCSGVVIPEQPRRLPRPVLTRAEARAVLHVPDLRTPQGIRDRALLELFYSSGLRRAEMARLTVHDVDLVAGFVRVRHGKGGRDRVVPMGEKARAALECYLREVRPEWLRAARAAMETAVWLSPLPPHGPLKAEAVAAIVCRLARQAGLGRGVSPHVWRHTCATHLVGNGADLAHVQRLLGHRSIRTTGIYARVAIPDLKRCLRRCHPRERFRR